MSPTLKKNKSTLKYLKNQLRYTSPPPQIKHSIVVYVFPEDTKFGTYQALNCLVSFCYVMRKKIKMNHVFAIIFQFEQYRQKAEYHFFELT